MDINTLFPIINADDFNRKYSVGRTIGVGKQGQVYCVTDNTTNEVFAIKQYHEESIKRNFRHTRNEIEALKKLNHINVIRLQQCFAIKYGNQTIYSIVMEYGGDKSLKDLNLTELTQYDKVNISLQLVRGLAAIHENGIIHRDLKPENVMLNDRVVKIVDLGLSRRLDHNNLTSTIVGSPLFMDPNIQGLYSNKCDVYSAGLIIYNIFTGHLLFGECSNNASLGRAQEKFFNSYKASINSMKIASKSIKQVIGKCLQKYEAQRYSAEQLRKRLEDLLTELEKTRSSIHTTNLSNTSVEFSQEKKLNTNESLISKILGRYSQVKKHTQIRESIISLFKLFTTMKNHLHKLKTLQTLSVNKLEKELMAFGITLCHIFWINDTMSFLNDKRKDQRAFQDKYRNIKLQLMGRQVIDAAINWLISQKRKVEQVLIDLTKSLRSKIKGVGIANASQEMILAIDRKDVEFLKNVSNDSLKECLIDLHSKMKKQMKRKGCSSHQINKIEDLVNMYLQ